MTLPTEESSFCSWTSPVAVTVTSSLAPPGCENFYVLSPVPHLQSGTDWKIEGEAKLISVYIGSDDTWHGQNLATAIVLRAREMGLAGATVMPGGQAAACAKSSAVARAMATTQTGCDADGLDVVVTIDYEALDSPAYREQVIREFEKKRTVDLTRSFSVRHQMPDQWYSLHHPEQSVDYILLVLLVVILAQLE